MWNSNVCTKWSWYCEIYRVVSFSFNSYINLLSWVDFFSWKYAVVIFLCFVHETGFLFRKEQLVLVSVFLPCFLRRERLWCGNTCRIFFCEYNEDWVKKDCRCTFFSEFINYSVFVSWCVQLVIEKSMVNEVAMMLASKWKLFESFFHLLWRLKYRSTVDIGTFAIKHIWVKFFRFVHWFANG